MRLQALTPEERKTYKHGDFIMYGKEIDTESEEQRELQKEYELEQENPRYYKTVLKVPCKYCGGIFYTRNVRRMYCSDRCINDAYMDRRKARQEAAREKVCPVCGKSFTAKSKAAIYCGQACKQKQYRKNVKTLL